MAYFRICPHCGAALDPGERCDCREEMAKQQEALERIVVPGRLGQMEFDFKAAVNE